MSAEGKSVQVFGKDSGLLVCNVVREKCPNTGKYQPEKIRIWTLFTQ